MLGENTCGQLLGRHFQREEADGGTIDDLVRAIALALDAIVLRNVVGDVRYERRFAHRWPAGQDDQVGVLQTAHAIVEIEQTS